MKTKFSIVLFLILNFCFSQDGIVYYKYINAIGVGNANGDMYNAYTMFTKGKSYYVTAKDSLESTVDKTAKLRNYENEDGSNNRISNGLNLTSEGLQVVCDFKTKILYSNIFNGENIYIKEDLPKFKWELKKDKKKIGKFNCVLATTYFRGRKYYVWFTVEIPVNSGPWKLNGLPGMILEAYDEDKNVSWSFQSYRFPISSNQDYNLRKNTKKVQFLTINEFSKYCKDEIESGYEAGLIVSKQFKNMKPIKGPMTSYYIESFE